MHLSQPDIPQHSICVEPLHVYKVTRLKHTIALTRGNVCTLSYKPHFRLGPKLPWPLICSISALLAGSVCNWTPRGRTRRTLYSVFQLNTATKSWQLSNWSTKEAVQPRGAQRTSVSCGGSVDDSVMSRAGSGHVSSRMIEACGGGISRLWPQPSS